MYVWIIKVFVSLKPKIDLKIPNNGISWFPNYNPTEPFNLYLHDSLKRTRVVRTLKRFQKKLKKLCSQLGPEIQLFSAGDLEICNSESKSWVFGIKKIWFFRFFVSIIKVFVGLKPFFNQKLKNNGISWFPSYSPTEPFNLYLHDSLKSLSDKDG